MRIPSGLLELYETSGYDGAGQTELHRVDREGGCLTLHISARDPEEVGSKTMHWSVPVERVVDFGLHEPSWDLFEIHESHLLLVPYTQHRVELYIKHSPSQIDVAAIQAWMRLQSHGAKGFMPNQVIGLEFDQLYHRLQRGFGQICEGPTVWIQALAEVLADFDAVPSLLPLNPISEYVTDINGSRYAAYQADRMRVVTFGSNWIVYEEAGE